MKKKFIGVKLIEAEPMTNEDWLNVEKVSIPIQVGGEPEEGYRVRYSNGYQSWCPKAAFESANLPISGENNSIAQSDVERLIRKTEVTTVGAKTTMVRAILINGFEIIETSSCVDVANYDQEIGAEICQRKINDRIWYLLGFLLQCGVIGFGRTD